MTRDLPRGLRVLFVLSGSVLCLTVFVLLPATHQISVLQASFLRPIVSPGEPGKAWCTPQQNVLFLKTHKSGSSTLTNILNRYADLRDLTVVIPRSKNFNRFGWPSPFHRSSVDQVLLNGQLANILSNHARYNRPEMDSIMENNTKYITILRNPVDNFESTFYYMAFYKYFKLPRHSLSLIKFFSQPSKYLTRALKKRGRYSPLHLARNGMFFDLGLPHKNRTVAEEAIKKIEKEFSLVLMTDYFDESMVLLKREFCWELNDVVYVKLNEGQKRANTSSKYKKDLKDAIHRWNWADCLLYDHFHKVFWDKVRSHGDGFKKDLQDFRKKNHDMNQECFAKNFTQGYQLIRNASKYSGDMCEKISLSPIDYLKYFRQKFYRRLRIANSTAQTTVQHKLRN